MIFFYDNASESINHRFKVKVQEQKSTTVPSGHISLNCTWVEAIDVYHRTLEETRRNIHRAVIGLGPYRLADQCKNCKVDPVVYMSPGQKVKCLQKIDSTAKLEEITDSPCTTDSANIVPTSALDNIHTLVSAPPTSKDKMAFEDSGLPEMMKHSWLNAEEILQKGGVAEAPGQVNARAVISLSNTAGLHKVTLGRNNVPSRCDCTKFQEHSLCAHMLAIGLQEQRVQQMIAECKPNLANTLRPTLSSKVGKKPSQCTRRHRTVIELRDVTVMK